MDAGVLLLRSVRLDRLDARRGELMRYVGKAYMYSISSYNAWTNR